MNVRMLLMAAVIYSSSAMAMEPENVKPIDPAMYKALSEACDRFENRDAQFIIKIASSMVTLFFPKSIGIINSSVDDLKTCCRQVHEALEANQFNQGGTVEACENSLKIAQLKFCTLKNVLRSVLVPRYGIDAELSQSISQLLRRDYEMSDEAQNYLAHLETWRSAVLSKFKNEPEAATLKNFKSLYSPLKIQLQYRPDLTGVGAKIVQLKELVKEALSKP